MLWVVRKDATPGRAVSSSTIHGAGRVMGRMEAKGKIDRKPARSSGPARSRGR